MSEAKHLQGVVSRYQKRIAQYGLTQNALATGDAVRRRIRYGVLADVGIRKRSSVLDVGCGLGSFRDYLFKELGHVRYDGLDAVPEFIDHCRLRYPESRFYLSDFLSFRAEKPYDFIVASQVFNNRCRDASNEKMARQALEKAYGLCRQGVAIDFMTSGVDFHERRLFYYDPAAVFRFAKKLTKRVTLRHDYPLYEFCIYLYRDFKGWRKSR